MTLRNELTRRMRGFDPPLTPIKLALMASLNRDAVRSIFRDDKSSEPGLFKIDTLADFFGCSVDDLLGRSDRHNHLAFKGNAGEKSYRKPSSEQIESSDVETSGAAVMTRDEARLLARFQTLTRERQNLLLKEAGNLVAEQIEEQPPEPGKRVVQLRPPPKS